MTVLRHIIYILLLVLAPATVAALPTATDTTAVLARYAEARKAIAEEANYAKSLECFLDFIHMAERDAAAYRPELMDAYSSVSVIYGAFNDFAQALAYNQKGYELSLELADARYQLTCLTNMSTSLMALKRYDEAAEYNERLLTVPTTDRERVLFSYYVTKGDIAQRTDQWTLAADCWRQALAIAEQNDFDNYRRSYPLSNLADYFEHTHQPDSQRIYLERAFTLAMGQRDPYPQVNCSRELMRFFTRQGDMAQALHYQDIFFGLTDSLMNLEEFLRISSDHGQMEIAERGQQIRSLSFTISRQKLIIWAVIIGQLLLLVFATLIYRQKRRLNRAYKAVFERNKELVGVEERFRALQQGGRPAEQADKSAPAADAATDELFDRILHVMDDADEYCDPSFGLARLTSLVGSNTVYVAKVIKDRTGMNVPAFINAYRIREARRRMTDQQHYGHYTIQAISESVGYSTQVHFNRTFKRVTGITPSIYQRMMREDAGQTAVSVDEMA